MYTVDGVWCLLCSRLRTNMHGTRKCPANDIFFSHCLSNVPWPSSQRNEKEIYIINRHLQFTSPKVQTTFPMNYLFDAFQMQFLLLFFIIVSSRCTVHTQPVDAIWDRSQWNEQINTHVFLHQTTDTDTVRNKLYSNDECE